MMKVAKNLLKYYSSDYIARNQTVFGDTGANVCTAIGTNTFHWYLLGNRNSKYLIRQIIASVFNITRLTRTIGLSAVDMGICQIFEKLNPNMRVLNSLASKQRFYERTMMTFRLNGGVYEEMRDFFANSLLALPPNAKTAAFVAITTNYPVRKSQYERSENNITIASIKNLFESQTGYEFFDVFRKISSSLSGSQTIIKRDAIFRDGTRVTITILPPHIERMRQLDLLPFKALQFILNAIPFMTVPQNLYNSFINRFTWNIPKEISARRKILESFGINNDESHDLLISNVNRLGLPITVPPPIMQYCGRNVMVTARQPQQLPEKQLTYSIAKSCSEFFSRMLFTHNLVIPNISPQNILASDGKIALERYAPITDFQASDLSNILIMLGGVKFNQTSLATQAAVNLNYNVSKITNAANSGNLGPAVDEVLRHHAQQMFALGEGVLGLSRFKNETGSNWVFEPFGKRLGLNGGWNLLSIKVQTNFFYSLFNRNREE